jgi:hypothetical protein
VDWEFVSTVDFLIRIPNQKKELTLLSPRQLKPDLVSNQAVPIQQHQSQQADPNDYPSMHVRADEDVGIVDFREDEFFY